MKKCHRQLEKNYINEWFPGFIVKLTKTLKPRISKNISSTLDLHGLTVHEAYKKCSSFIEDHYYCKSDNIVIITGRSGQINDEFLSWIMLSKYVRLCEQLPNKGSYKLWLLKQK